MYPDSLDENYDDEGLAETLEILADEKLIAGLKIGIEQINNKQLIDFVEFKNSLH